MKLLAFRDSPLLVTIHHLLVSLRLVRFQYRETLPCNCDKEQYRTNHRKAETEHRTYSYLIVASLKGYLHHNRWMAKYFRMELQSQVLYHRRELHALQKALDGFYETHLRY